MKTLSLEEKKAVAAGILERYPNAKKVAVTSDGEAFICDDGDLHAKHHAKKNRHGKELSISNFTRDDVDMLATEDEGVSTAKVGKKAKTATPASDEPNKTE